MYAMPSLLDAINQADMHNYQTRQNGEHHTPDCFVCPFFTSPLVDFSFVDGVIPLDGARAISSTREKTRRTRRTMTRRRTTRRMSKSTAKWVRACGVTRKWSSR